MKVCAMTAAAMVLAAGAAAQQDTRVPDNGNIDYGRLAGVVYVNMATGERKVVSYEPRHSGALWSNTDSYTQDGGIAFHRMDGVAQNDGRATYNSVVVDWGDIDFGAHVDGIRIAYGVPDTIASPNTDSGSPDYGVVPGLNILYGVWINENGQHDGSVNTNDLVALLDFPDAYGAVDDRNIWQIVFDLQGFNEFDLRGDDQDGDGKVDFGYGYSFRQRQHVDPRNIPSIPRGGIGPVIVTPGNAGGGGTPPSDGVQDALDWYNTFDAGFVFNSATQTYDLDPNRSHSRNNYVNTYFFNGEPYASYYTQVYGVIRDFECIADFNSDGFVDFFDYADFVNCFEINLCPPGQSPDVNGDDFIDFFDYSDYVAAFEAGC